MRAPCEFDAFLAALALDRLDEAERLIALLGEATTFLLLLVVPEWLGSVRYEAVPVSHPDGISNST